MTKAAELRDMSDDQLQLTLKDTTESLFRLRLQAETEGGDVPNQLKKHRRLIARVQTIQNERARAAAAKATATAAASVQTEAQTG
jgi:large subunit ribosomal protein L29